MINIDTSRADWRGAVATSVLLGLGCAGVVALLPGSTLAAEAEAKTYRISPQALGTALQEFAAQAGVQLLFSESDVAGLKTPGLQGSFSREQAVQKLLAGSDLVFEFPKPDTLVIRRSGPSDGQTHPAADLSEVVVTGRAGVDERTKAQTSYSVTNIDNERLRLQGPTSVTESLKSVPGFWVEASGGEASGNVRARGVPVDGYGSITLLEDGMPVQHDPALGYLNGDQAFRLDETIDRIEVVRGGPSTIFYSNAPAGAVNFIPRRVGDRAQGVVKYTAGDYGLNRVDAWYGAPVGDWKLSLGGFYRYDNGIRDPGFHADDGGQFRVSLARDFAKGKMSFDVKHLDDSVALYLGIPMRTYPDGEIRAVPGFDGNYGTLAGPETAYLRMKTVNGPDYLFDDTLGTHVNRTQLTGNFQLEVANHLTFDDHVRYDDTKTQRNGMFPNSLLSGAKLLSQSGNFLKSIPGATALQLQYVDSPGTVFNPASQNGNALVTVGGLRGLTIPIKELMNDARLMRKFEVGSQSHDVTLGLYVADISQGFSRYSSSVLLDVRDNARLLDMVAVDATGKVIQSVTDHGVYQYGYEWANATGQSTTTAAYLADEWQITDRLRLDAGARWEQVHLTANVEERQTVNVTSSTLATSQMLTGTGQFAQYEQTFSKVGWTLGANYQFGQNAGVFARFTPAFRLPKLSTYTGASPTPGNTTVAPPPMETMELGEVGYKFANDWTEIYATAFWTKYNDVGFTNYVLDLNTGVSQSETTYADTRTYGLELEGGFYPVRWFDFSYSATLEDPKYDGLRYTDKVNNLPVYRDFDGNQLIRVPKVSVRLVPAVNLFNQRLRLQAAWEYEGGRYVDTANSVVLPAYDTLNASARWSIADNFDLYGYADNITNSLGLTEGNPRAGEVQSADAGANTFIARPILGRAFRVALMYRF
jgi:outer membrane receptor protein involved in Fe transport